MRWFLFCPSDWSRPHQKNAGKKIPASSVRQHLGREILESSEIMTDNQIAVIPLEVIQDKRLTLEQTRVLIALFSFRNKVTNTVWPSRKAIAERTGMHPSNISSATTALVALGWLAKDGLGGYSKATRYTLCSPDLAPKSPARPAASTVAQTATVAEQATVAASATQTVARSATPLLADQATRKEQSIEQSIEEKKTVRVTAPTFALPDWINKSHWDAWHSTAKRKNASPAQKQMAVDKLAAWKAEGIDHAAALENAALAGWQGLFKPDVPASAVTASRSSGQTNKHAGAAAAIWGNNAQRNRGDFIDV